MSERYKGQITVTREMDGNHLQYKSLPDRVSGKWIFFFNTLLPNDPGDMMHPATPQVTEL